MASSTPARLIGICADDAGFAPGIAETAFELGAQGRLSDATCITTTACWPDAARFIRRQPKAGGPATRWGLHLNLSHGTPLSASLRAVWPEFPSLALLIARAHGAFLPTAAIADEAAAQLDAFTQAMGRPPAFIDGHQHVHHLPGVRDAVVRMAAAARPGLAVRSTGRLPGPGFAFKRAVIERSGGRALARLLANAGLGHNRTLFGIYDFSAAPYRSRVQQWLGAVAEKGSLLICHPAILRAPDPDGPAMGEARRVEADYLASPAFADDLAEAGVALGDPWLSAEGLATPRIRTGT
ncbi:MAG: ChbG/HpnK family deacetylase [Caldimonas sp.]